MNDRTKEILASNADLARDLAEIMSRPRKTISFEWAIACSKCHKETRSLPGEMEDEFIERVKREGWLPNRCPECAKKGSRS